MEPPIIVPRRGVLHVTSKTYFGASNVGSAPDPGRELATGAGISLHPVS